MLAFSVPGVLDGVAMTVSGKERSPQGFPWAVPASTAVPMAKLWK